MGKLREFEVTFEKKKVVYSPGESICGTVTINVNQPLLCKGEFRLTWGGNGGGDNQEVENNTGGGRAPRAHRLLSHRDLVSADIRLKNLNRYRLFKVPKNQILSHQDN